MRLFLTIEAQKANESGLTTILKDVTETLSFVTDKKTLLENTNNYGREFRVVSIIPTCVDDVYWTALGWKERVHISRKKREADIRLKINYNQFICATPEIKRLMFIDIVIKSINILQTKAKEDFNGKKLVDDILNAFNVSTTQLEQVNF